MSARRRFMWLLIESFSLDRAARFLHRSRATREDPLGLLLLLRTPLRVPLYMSSTRCASSRAGRSRSATVRSRRGLLDPRARDPPGQSTYAPLPSSYMAPSASSDRSLSLSLADRPLQRLPIRLYLNSGHVL